VSREGEAGYLPLGQRLLHQSDLGQTSPTITDRFGYRVKRGTEEFAALYRKRAAVERVNSRLKDKRRLDSHCQRGLQKVNLHCTMAVIAMSAMALAKAENWKGERASR